MQNHQVRLQALARLLMPFGVKEQSCPLSVCTSQRPQVINFLKARFS